MRVAGALDTVCVAWAKVGLLVQHLADWEARLPLSAGLEWPTAGVAAVWGTLGAAPGWATLPEAALTAAHTWATSDEPVAAPVVQGWGDGHDVSRDAFELPPRVRVERPEAARSPSKILFRARAVRGSPVLVLFLHVVIVVCCVVFRLWGYVCLHDAWPVVAWGALWPTAIHLATWCILVMPPVAFGAFDAVGVLGAG